MAIHKASKQQVGVRGHRQYAVKQFLH